MFVVHQVPTVIVLALLAGLGLYGHYSHWKLPKFSTLIGSAEPVRKDWCEEHGVPESKCVECNPTLFPKGPDHGWCAEHGVHNCPLHHPDVAQLKEPAAVTPADFERAARALALMDRPQNNSVCKVYQRRIQFASIEAVKQAGVDVELVDRQPVGEWVAGNGEITYDQTRFTNLSPRAAGTIWSVEKKIGDRVQAGDVLAIVDSALVGQAKSELVDALVQEHLQRKTVARLQGLGEGVVAGKQLLEAEAAFEKARVAVQKAQQSLANLGLPVDLEVLRDLPNEKHISHLRHLGLEDAIASETLSQVTSANLLPVRSPADGVIIERRVVAGEVVDSSAILFQIADNSRMWLNLSIPMEEAAKLSIGQPVRFRADGSHEELTGELNWISTAADKQTRMIKVRAELPNSDGRLRDETFGSGRIILREEQEAIVVPNESVHWEGCCFVVFVRDKHYFESDSPKVFHVRSVRIGAKSEKFTEIIAGVLPGEVLASKGSDVLTAQLLKNNLGEGCTCVE
jgi:multidrug efflux pump subunit AcrA (membrane-fusion protein)